METLIYPSKQNTPIIDILSNDITTNADDPCFPFPGWPGHHNSTSQGLKIILCMMKEHKIQNFGTYLCEAITYKKQNFLRNLTLNTFIQLVKVGEYSIIWLDI